MSITARLRTDIDWLKSMISARDISIEALSNKLAASVKRRDKLRVEVGIRDAEIARLKEAFAALIEVCESDGMWIDDMAIATARAALAPQEKGQDNAV